MLSIVQAKADEIHARRIGFDGIDVLLGRLDHPIAERREIYRIRDWLFRTGLTGIITLEIGWLEPKPTLQLPAVHCRLRGRSPASVIDGSASAIFAVCYGALRHFPQGALAEAMGDAQSSVSRIEKHRRPAR